MNSDNVNVEAYKVARKLMGYSQQEIGDRMFVSKATISNIEWNKPIVSRAMYKYYDITMRELLKYADDSTILIVNTILKQGEA